MKTSTAKIFERSEIKIEAYFSITVGEDSNGQQKVLDVKCGKTGVYELRNLQTGEFYIGMSHDLYRRYDRHFRELKAGKHPNHLLQNDYNNFVLDIVNDGFRNPDDIYPRELFDFRIIQFCRESELTLFEHLLIKYLNPWYNIHKDKEIKIGE